MTIHTGYWQRPRCLNSLSLLRSLSLSHARKMRRHSRIHYPNATRSLRLRARFQWSKTTLWAKMQRRQPMFYVGYREIWGGKYGRKNAFGMSMQHSLASLAFSIVNHNAIALVSFVILHSVEKCKLMLPPRTVDWVHLHFMRSCILWACIMCDYTV